MADAVEAQLRERWGSGPVWPKLIRSVWRKVWFGHGDGAVVYTDAESRIYHIQASTMAASWIVRAAEIRDDACMYPPKRLPWWWKGNVSVRHNTKVTAE